jgi:hypothetical protein
MLMHVCDSDNGSENILFGEHTGNINASREHMFKPDTLCRIVSIKITKCSCKGYERGYRKISLKIFVAGIYMQNNSFSSAFCDLD